MFSRVRSLLGMCLLICLVSACTNSSSRSSSPDPTYDAKGDERAGGGWFCEMSENEEDWNCVRDQALVANPQPSRVPSGPPQDHESPGPESPDPDRFDATDTSRPNAPSSAALRQDPTPSTRPTRAAPPPNQNNPQTTEVPKHVRLSYQPSQPMALMDLPADFWVVQLVSVSSKEALERYAIEHQFRGMSAARVWSQNQFFYILILGIYETKENAAAAS